MYFAVIVLWDKRLEGNPAVLRGIFEEFYSFIYRVNLPLYWYQFSSELGSTTRTGKQNQEHLELPHPTFHSGRPNEPARRGRVSGHESCGEKTRDHKKFRNLL